MSARHDGSAGAGFSLARFVAIALKELVQMRRDRLTFAMMLGIPILQLLLFGFAWWAPPLLGGGIVMRS